MGYDLQANNSEAGYFHFGAFSFSILLEACGYLWPCIQNGQEWYCVFGIDERMPEGDSYPSLISNDGFPVSDEEAQIMARIARNFVAIQRSLPDENKSEDVRSKQTFERGDVMDALMRGMFGGSEEWPVKVRDGFTEKFAAFAEWADRSGGFAIC
jgi:hypothetical protein